MTETLFTQPKVNIFAALSAEELYILGRHAEMLTVPAGAEVFAEGSHGRELFVVIEGSLCAVMRKANEEEMVLGEIHPGDVFGEMSFLDGFARTASIRCTGDATLLRLTWEQFRQLKEDYPAIAAMAISDLVLTLALRLRATTRLIAALNGDVAGT